MLCYKHYQDIILLLQEPWEKHPLVSIACHEQNWVSTFYDLGPNCSALVVQSYTSWQWHPSILYMACLFYSFCLQFPTSMSSTSCYPPSCICCQTVGVSSEWLFVADPFQFWVCHIFHGLFFVLSNWYVGSFGNSTSQMPAVCLWSFCCMSRFHTHIALCWMLLFPIYVFVSLVMFSLFQIFSVDFVTSVALPILVHKSCEQSLSYVNTLPRYVNRVTFCKV